jgi:hypothetical protein
MTGIDSRTRARVWDRVATRGDRVATRGDREREAVMR